jgi:TonB family protein
VERSRKRREAIEAIREDMKPKRKGGMMSLMNGGPRRRLLVPPCLLIAALSCLLPVVVRAQDAPKAAGSEVPAPKRTKTVLPEYPPEAQAQGIRGIVILDIVIDVQGRVASAEVIRSIGPLDEAALAAVRKWEYEVTKVDGKPVSVRLTVPITFALKVPDVSRQDGVPELRQGAAPAFPPEAARGKGGASVTAEVTLDSEGSVADALVTSGASPWTEALLQALRTWKFAPEEPGTVVAFRVEARFEAGSKGAAPRVELRLTNPRKSKATAPPPSAAAAAPSPSAPAAPPGPAASPAPAAAQAAEPKAPPQPKPSQPPVEMLSAPPPKSTAPAVVENGVSAIHEVALSSGVPDLIRGRRPVPPPLARMAGATGSVQVRFSVNAAGGTTVLGSDGPEILRPAAEDTVASWAFRRASADRLHLVAAIDYRADGATAKVRPDEPPQP